MQQPDFTTTSYGKWILCGEHAALRGCPALLFPVRNKNLILHYWATNQDIAVEFTGEHRDIMQILFWGTLQRAIKILHIPPDTIFGKVVIENNIPIGAGMGASAAICVAIARLFIHLGHITETKLFELARQLENLFHEESSGADIAAAMAGTGIHFSRHHGYHPIKLAWQPSWYLSYSGMSSVTAKCVKQVKALWQKDPARAEKIDLDMAKSVNLAEQALQMQQDSGLPLLTEAINIALDCFRRWQLCDGQLHDHIENLFAAGAIAAKPTGAGGGGFVLSLWNHPPSANLKSDLIPV